MNIDDVKKLTVEKLKVELKARDLDTSGKKADLAERLEAHLQTQPAETTGQANGTSTSAPAQNGSTEAAPSKGRKPIVWSAAVTETASTAPAASESADAPATEADTPAEAAAAEKTEAEKQKARALKYGVSTDTVDTTAKEAGKRKLEEVETAALVSDDMIAKRRERFKTQEDKITEERQKRFKPDAGKQAERKERFQKWLPSGGSDAPGMAKAANADVAAAIGTSLDKTLRKGPKGKPTSKIPQTENFSDEFKAKAEARKARFAAKPPAEKS